MNTSGNKMNLLKSILRKFSLIIVLALLLLHSGCTIPPTPKWDAFCEELISDYPEIVSIKLSVGNRPSLPVYIVVAQDDIETKNKIAKEVIFFILSEDGYPEILEYYKKRSGQSSDYFDFWVNFCNEEDYPSFYTSYFSKKDWPLEDNDKMRGFNNWGLSLKDADKAIPINFDEIGIEANEIDLEIGLETN